MRGAYSPKRQVQTERAALHHRLDPGVEFCQTFRQVAANEPPAPVIRTVLPAKSFIVRWRNPINCPGHAQKYIPSATLPSGPNRPTVLHHIGRMDAAMVQVSFNLSRNLQWKGHSSSMTKQSSSSQPYYEFFKAVADNHASQHYPGTGWCKNGFAGVNGLLLLRGLKFPPYFQPPTKVVPSAEKDGTRHSTALPETFEPGMKVMEYCGRKRGPALHASSAGRWAKADGLFV